MAQHAQAPAQAALAHGLITALGVGQICSWGSLYYSFPQIAEAMGVEQGWSKPELYGAATLGLLLAALLAYPVGVAVDRGYGRAVMGGASLAAAALLALWSQVQSLTTFYVLAAGIGGLQAATLYEPAFAVLARRMGAQHSRRGITALTLWGGFASTVFIPLVHAGIEHWGWRDTLMMLAAVNAVVCAGVYYGFIRASLDVRPDSTLTAGAQRLMDRSAIHIALRNPVFWLLMIAMVGYAGMFSAFTFHMYPMLLEFGLDGNQVVQTIAMIGPAQVFGRILMGTFGGRSSVRAVGVAVVALFPIAFGALALGPFGFTLAAGVCIVYGAANGVFTIVRGMAVPEMLSRHAYGALNGILAVPSTLARAGAPLAAAAVWSWSASYGLVLVGIIAAALTLAGGFRLAASASRRTPSATEIPA
jgi:predicted MFS family arabinose efflux permease